MRGYETVWGALPEAPECGRPEGHNGQCRSAMALKREHEKNLSRQRRWKRERREREQQERRRAVLAEALREFDGYGRAA